MTSFQSTHGDAVLLQVGVGIDLQVASSDMLGHASATAPEPWRADAESREEDQNEPRRCKCCDYARPAAPRAPPRGREFVVSSCPSTRWCGRRKPLLDVRRIAPHDEPPQSTAVQHGSFDPTTPGFQTANAHAIAPWGNDPRLTLTRRTGVCTTPSVGQFGVGEGTGGR